jgi:hypothetical protein
MARGKKTGGRQKGTPNKATAAARQTLAVFMDGNADRLQGWLDKIERQKGPLAAFQAYVSLMEFHLPKRQRIAVESQGSVAVSLCWADGTPLTPPNTPRLLPTST